MADDDDPKAAERELLAAARAGRLAEYLEKAPEAGNAALYDLVSNLVYERLTREIERHRGHHRCALSIQHLEPDCHDRHQDDVAAVRDDLLRHAGQPIQNLPGFLVSRLKAATIDAHRRRRGDCGAQQRPRLPLPRWLADELGPSPWLWNLAVEILIWVGVPTAVRGGLWPLGAWTGRRSAVTGVPGSTEAEVADDVERVLAAMRTNRAWYERYVERPLGHKQAPLVVLPSTDSDQAHGTAPLALVQQHEIDDARLTGLAAEAVDAIEARVRRGEDLRSAVVHVIGVLFGSGTCANPATVDRIVAAAMSIIGDPR